MTREELTTEAARLEANAKSLREQASKLRHEELLATDKAERLVYAATARCPCGAGMAYDPAEEGHGVFRGPDAWDCSAILLGTADAAVKHEARLPFAFYDVKSEGQASANGRTTRPPKPS